MKPVSNDSEPSGGFLFSGAEFSTICLSFWSRYSRYPRVSFPNEFRRKACPSPFSSFTFAARLNSLSCKIILAREISQHRFEERTKADRSLSLRDDTIHCNAFRGSPERDAILFRGKCSTRIIKQLSTFRSCKLCRHVAAFKILPQPLLFPFDLFRKEIESNVSIPRPCCFKK